MSHKIIVVCSAVVLSAASLSSPVYAWTHHRHGHNLQYSTPAERAQTADLNRQQLAQAQAATTAPGNSNLMTEPTSYQRPAGNPGMSGNAPSGAAGATEGPGAGAGEDQNVGAPNPTAPNNIQGSPNGTVTPPPANNSSTPQ